MTNTKMSRKNLSKEVQKVLAGATPRQKALLVCREYFEASTLMYKDILTQDEIDAIRNSLQTDREKTIYNKYIRIYNFFSTITPIIGLVYKEYQAEAETLLGYLRVWEAYDQEENHLTLLYDHLNRIEPEEAKKAAIAAFKEAIPHLRFDGAKMSLSKDGYPEVTIKRLYKDIEEEVDDVKTRYRLAKAVVLVVEDYATKNHAKDFLPDMTKEALEQIKADYVLTISPRYSRRELKIKIDKGLNVTEEDKKRAVFPSYEEIEPTQKELDLIESKLMSYR